MSDDVEVMGYALAHGVGIRRDGVGSPWHEQNWIGSPRYASVQGMADAWKKAPVVFEWYGDYDYLKSQGWSFDAAVNRPRRTHHRGPLLIHAGLSLESYTEENIEWLDKKYGVHIPLELDTGGIVGVVDVVDCVENHRSKWFIEGNYGWVLANPRLLAFRRCRGALGVFRPQNMTMSDKNK
jgi:hypothetical protein